MTAPQRMMRARRTAERSRIADCATQPNYGVMLRAIGQGGGGGGHEIPVAVRRLGWLAAGMSPAEIVEDFPELTEADIRAALAFAADRERRTLSAAE